MGDRGYAKLTFTEDRMLVLYTHWCGSDLVELVRAAIKAGAPRWGDDDYLARILVTRIVHQNEDCLSETGWGLSPLEDCDGDLKITVDVPGQRVMVRGEWATFKEFTDG